jgi:hypothetical protein
MLQERMLLGRHTTGSVQPTNVGTVSRAQSQTSTRGQQPAEPLTETIKQTPQADERNQSQQPPLTYNNFERFREYTLAYPQHPKGLSVPPIIPSSDTDSYKAIPLIEFGNEKLDPKTINVFTKMWDREKKYTGKPYDLLDDKLKIFYSICYHANI